jgi:hypothetical protein
MELIQCYKHFVSSLKHFLQILQKLEFIHVTEIPTVITETLIV